MKDWRALPSQGGVIGCIFTAAAAVLFGLSLVLVWLSATASELQVIQVEDAPAEAQPDPVRVFTGTNLGTFLLGLLSIGLLGLVVYLAYQTRRYFALRYTLDRNAITVELGDSRQVIPLENIRYIVKADTVVGQMRQRVFSHEEEVAAEAASRSPKMAYPRQQTGPLPRTEAPEAQPDAAETEVAQDELDLGRSYRLTQTAAADSSLEHLEQLEVIQAEVVEVEAEDPAPESPVHLNLEDDQLEVEEGQITEVEPAQVRTLALSEDSWESGSSSNPEEATSHQEEAEPPDPFGAGSVNFTVTAKPFTSWPGFYLNQAQVSTLGSVQFFATQPLTQTLLIRTAEKTYAISPRDRQQFLTEYKLRRRLGAIEAVEEGLVKGSFLSHPLWTDRLGRGLILAGVILNLLLFVFLLWRFNDLSPILRIHFNKLGQVDRIGERGELMLLPFIGLLTVVGNSAIGAWLHPKERVVAYLLYGSAIAMQVLTAIAVFVILVVS